MRGSDHGDHARSRRSRRSKKLMGPHQSTSIKAGAITLIAAALFLAAQSRGGDRPAEQAKQQASSSTSGRAAGAGARHDHVGKPLPDYMTGDQCLFCHGDVVGATWEREPHAWTAREVGIEPRVPQLPKDATHIIGSPL